MFGNTETFFLRLEIEKLNRNVVGSMARPTPTPTPTPTANGKNAAASLTTTTTNSRNTAAPATTVINYKSPNTHPTPPSPYPFILTLNISGRKFPMSRGTLRQESGLFARLLSPNTRWNPSADGTYFIGVDPDIFSHIARFMQQPKVFPLFYNPAKGGGGRGDFDYDLYNRVQVEAEYFEIEALSTWIKEKRYLDAVKVELRMLAPVVLGRDEVALPTVTMGADEFRELHFVPRVKRVYRCPRGIEGHDKEDKCGVRCRAKQGRRGAEYEEEDYLECVVVEGKVVVDADVCRAKGEDVAV